MESTYHCIIQLSTVSTAMKAVESLVVLAQNPGEHTAALCASAAVAAASALDQCTIDVLAYYALLISSDCDVPIEALPHTALKSKTLRVRMRDTPSVLTDGRLVINRSSHLFGALNDLVTHRNTIMHISDEPQHLTEQDENVELADGKLVIKIPVPKSPWDSVSLAQARVYHEAVKCYVGEVMQNEPDAMRPGQLLVHA